MPQHDTPMTDDDYARIRPVLDMAGRLSLGLHTKLIERGVEPIDALLAATEATVNLAKLVHGGDPIRAIEWTRDAIDVIERQVLAEAAARH